MDKLRNYDVVFSGLKNGKHEFRFEIDQAFFQLFEVEKEFTHPKLMVEVLLNKHSTFLEFSIKTSGTVQLICDITNEDFEYPLENTLKILVKFGEKYDDSHEEVIIIPHQDHAFNIAQLILEEVMLSIPMKKVSPNVTEEDLEILEKYSPKNENWDKEEKIEEQESDPRWNALKNLKK